MRRLLPIAVALSIVALIAITTRAASPVPTYLATTPTRSGVFLPLVRNPPTLTPTNTATATTPPTNTPIVTSTPLPHGLIVLPNHSLFTRSSSSFLHVVGEVLNNTGRTTDFVKVSVDVFNGSQLVATDYTYTAMFTVRAGDKTCFDILVEKPAAWTSYQFEPVQFGLTNAATPNLTLLNVSSSIDGLGDYHIIGQVRNDLGVKVTDVEPVGTLYNASGTVLDCDYTFVNITDLNPGQTSAFNIDFFSREFYSDVASYRVQVGANLP